MTAISERSGPTSRDDRNAAKHYRWVALSTVLVSLGSSLLFYLWSPDVGDLWAARARYQAAHDGVGLGYWFSWYSGAHSPGSYSVAAAQASRLFGGPELLAATSCVAISGVLISMRRSILRPGLALVVGSISANLTLWAGRVPFIVSAVFSVLSIALFLRNRTILSILLMTISGLFSPLAVAFLLLIHGPLAMTSRKHAAHTFAGLIFLAVSSQLWVGGGPEGFGVTRAIISALLLGIYLFARPGRPLTLVCWATLASVAIFSALPNAIGSNLARMVFIVLPAAIAGMSQLKSKRLIALIVSLPLLWSAWFTLNDLKDSGDPSNSEAFYRPLVSKLRTLPNVEQFRVETIAGGTHSDAFYIPRVAWMARGYETQADREISDAVVDREGYMSTTQLYRFLESSSSRYVAINVHPRKRTGEWNAASQAKGDWREVWRNEDWELFEVPSVTPIVETGAGRIISRSQSSVVIDIGDRGSAVLKTKYSPYLRARTVSGRGEVGLSRTQDGWTEIRSSPKQRVVLSSKL